jgi:CRP-like cAMP-binding protein
MQGDATFKKTPSPHPAMPLLASSTLCKGLAPEEIERLVGLLQPVQAAMGEKIVCQGDTNGDLYFIESGQVEAVVNIPAAKSAALARMGPGEHFGEIAFIGGGERSSDVVALGPVRLWRLGREQFLGSLGSLANLHQRLAQEALKRTRNQEHQATLAKEGAQTAVELILDKIMGAELPAFRSEDKSPGVNFDQIIEFYKRTRFLYPAKMQELETRFDRVRQTWQGLLRGNNEIFKLLCLMKPVEGVVSITNSICAYQYSPNCWQIQHLVSAPKLGLTGTLLALLGLGDWFRSTNYPGYHRFTYRPDNPGVTQLFSHYSQQLGSRKFHSGLFDYIMEPLEKVELAINNCQTAGFPTAVVEGTPAPDEVEFVSRHVHEVELSALALDHAGWGPFAEKFSTYGLVRKRLVLIARDASGRVVGSAISNVASEGMNFSFLENALEYVFVEAGLDQAGRVAVLAGLLGAGCGVMKRSSRDYLVCMINPELSREMEQFDMHVEKSKQYAVATYTANIDDLASVHQATIRYYRELLLRNV